MGSLYQRGRTWWVKYVNGRQRGRAVRRGRRLTSPSSACLAVVA
jgi:hypothetical protein